jgi:hypothetical protein
MCDRLHWNWAQLVVLLSCVVLCTHKMEADNGTRGCGNPDTVWESLQHLEIRLHGISFQVTFTLELLGYHRVVMQQQHDELEAIRA